MNYDVELELYKQLVKSSVDEMTRVKPAGIPGKEYFRDTFMLLLGRVHPPAERLLDRASFEMNRQELDELGRSLQDISEKGLEAYHAAICAEA